jgi:hypothetical protein
MTRKEYLKELRLFLDTVYETVEKKSADYAHNANPFSAFESAGIIDVPVHKSLLTRTLEKVLRINHLCEREAQVKQETVYDSLLDVVGYMAILNAYLKMSQVRDKL